MIWIKVVSRNLQDGLKDSDALGICADLDSGCVYGSEYSGIYGGAGAL